MPVRQIDGYHATHGRGRGARIVLTTFGSLGDLHPYVAIALGLQARGHDPVIATSDLYQARVQALGLGFCPVRPDRVEQLGDPGMMERMRETKRGPDQVFRDMFMPSLRESYLDTLTAARGADLLISHTLAFATRLVAERTGIPWVSSVLQPLALFSAYDPPAVGPAALVSSLLALGPAVHRPLVRGAKWSLRGWSEPWHELRAEVGLPPTDQNPIFDGQHSPLLVLALFSHLIGARQPDWPGQTVVTGFPFFDERRQELPATLARFLDDGPPPIVFTLGTSAVMQAGAFYEQSAAAAAMLGRRAVLLTGKDPRNRPSKLPAGVIAVDYVPFGALFPHAAVVVHQGGIGTTAEAMRTGRPMLVVPFAHDQPDNARRVSKLRIGRTLSRRAYTAERVAAKLGQLLDDRGVAMRAAKVGAAVRAEAGVDAACDAIEAAIGAVVRSPDAG
ncbi:MAG: glycosyltransferase [Chloroflexota bacterium]|nr:glycosyltransferase [Chloroflexota bacterium]